MLIARHSITEKTMISSDGAARVEDTIAYPACRIHIIPFEAKRLDDRYGMHVAAEEVGRRWSLQNVYFSVKIPQRA